MSDIEARIDIKAPPHQVWAVLTDFASYPDWNPYLRELRGEAVEGRALSVIARIATDKERQFWGRVRNSEAPDLLRLRCELIGAGLLGCDHSFMLAERADACSTLEQRVHFFGPLAALIRGRVVDDLNANIDAMSQALRARAEGAGQGVLLERSGSTRQTPAPLSARTIKR